MILRAIQNQLKMKTSKVKVMLTGVYNLNNREGVECRM